MNPLRVALVVKTSPSTRERERRNMGWWSYPVPEFEWEHFDIYQAAQTLLSGFDLVFIEDVTKRVDVRTRGLPVVFHSFDDTLSENHFQVRFEQAKLSDLILVDHGPLGRFKPAGPAVRRFNFCVNDRVYSPGEKIIDVVFHCGSGESKGQPGGKERNELRAALGEISRSLGYDYRSGTVGLDEYAANMGSGRVVVNWPRTIMNRPHRVFDAMACGTALLTGPIPTVDGDGFVLGENYRSYTDLTELERQLNQLLFGGEWKAIARAGRDLIIHHHTWAIRAQELRQLLEKELGL